MLAWTAFFAFASAVLALRYWLLPDIERYRDRIVAEVARTVGQQVEIGAIEAGWLGLRPQVHFSDVRIHDAAGREALVLPSVDNVVSWRSLLYGELRLHRLRIEGPRLFVRRDPAGRLHIAGMELHAGGNAGGSARPADWLLDQGEIEIRNAEIEWHDEKRGAPPLVLGALDLRVTSFGGRHSIGVSARPPAELGSTVEVRARLQGESFGDLAAWSGRLYAELGTTDLAAWRPWVDYPVDVTRGHGALRFWLTLERGHAGAATADVALADVAASLGEGLVPLELASVRGRLEARTRADGYELSGRNLQLAAVHGPPLQPTDFQLAWRPAGGGSPESGLLAARLIELAPLAQLAGSFPLPAEARRLLVDLEPRGELLDARLDWVGSPEAPQRVSGRARFAALAMRPHGPVPGFSGLSGTIEATPERGKVHLVSRQAEVDLPGVLPEPRIPLEALNGQVEWERRPAGDAMVRIGALAFANADFAGTASGTYHWVAGTPGTADLTASLSRADLRRAGRYLPHPSMLGGAPVRDWLAAAVLGGAASDVQLRLKGDLARFPFTDPAAGTFRVTGRFEKGTLAYAPGWPRVEDIAGELRIEGDGIEALARSGAILGTRIANVRAGIEHMDAPAPVVVVSGSAEGLTSDFLRFIEVSPVRAMTDGMASSFRATGRGRLALKVDLPLKRPEATRVAGDYEFSGNTVAPPRPVPAVERASGRLSFTQDGFTLHNLRGRALGGAVAASGGTRNDGAIELTVRGEASLYALAAIYDHPWQRQLSGAAPYTATAVIRAGATRLTVESSLRGVSSTLPAPLAKGAAEALPLRVEVFPVEGGARDRISVALGRVAALEMLRRREGDALEVQRAALWLNPVPGESMRVPERPGTLVYGSLPGVDVDRWLALLPPIKGDGAAQPGSPHATLGQVTFDMQLGHLDVYGKRLRNAAVKASVDAQGWTAQVDAHEMQGELFYRDEAGGQLIARLSRLMLPDDAPAAPGGGGGATQPSQPRDLPGIDVVAERFTFRGKQLGRVEVAAQRSGADWRIDKLIMVNADASLRAKGAWRAGALSRSTLDFDLDAADSGRFLARIGYPDLVRGGKAELRGAVSWNGDPMTIHYPSLSGDVSLHAEEGQFLEVDPGGAGRLVSLLSLQALPRRITLDFRDVFSKGFQFERIDGKARLERGVMQMDEFHMAGSSAQVDMTGQVDLARETQDLKARIRPSLGDTASAAVAIVNPVAGVAAAIAQRVFKDPLGRIFAYEYAISGSWADPKVEKIAAPEQPVNEPVSP